MKSKTARAKPSPITTHNEFLARVTPEQRVALNKLRATIQQLLPDARECISYQLPAFCLDGRPVIAYGAGRNHCSLYPMSGSVVAALAADLATYDTSKGTIRFPAGKPFPKGLLKKIIAFRLAEISLKPTARSTATAKAKSPPKSSPKSKSNRRQK